MHITPYSHGDVRVIDPLRVRKLLLKRKEIDYLFGKVKERGLSVIPLKLYFKGARVKLEVGLGRGKKLYDKRHDIADRDARRDIERATRIRGSAPPTGSNRGAPRIPRRIPGTFPTVRSSNKRGSDALLFPPPVVWRAFGVTYLRGPPNCYNRD